jgi:ligand-binding SRPBCC domain-containing protein
MFASFEHKHTFATESGITVMHDTLTFSAPLGPLGLLAEKFVLRSYLKRFLEERNRHIKHTAESDEWRSYLTEEK